MTALDTRDLVVVEGRDAAKYLQGQLSQDVVALAVGESAWSFLLEPTGKLGFLVRARRAAEERFVLDVECGKGEAVITRLQRFLIRTKAELTLGMALIDVDPDPARTVFPEDLVGWWGEGTHRLASSAVPYASSEAPEPGDVTRARVAAGWPGAAELTEGLIPAETGLVQVAANFKKGCYTGQELVARVDSRGNHAPHHLERIVLTEPAGVGSVVVVDGAVAGTLSSVAGLQALAYLRRSVEAPADAVVDGHPAQVVPQRV